MTHVAPSQSSAPTIAYLAEGKLYLKRGDGEPQLIESPFVQQMLDRIERNRQRHGWKDGGGMAWQSFGSGGMMPMMGLGGMGGMPADVRRVRFSGLTRGTKPGELTYALDTDHVGGLFVYDTAERYERRVYHRNQFRAASLARHPATGTLALSVRGEDGTAHVAVMDADGRGLKEVTEGDCIDESPHWAPGEKPDSRVLVFQSAGVARNPAGFAVGLGTYAIQKLDLDSGEFVTLLEEDEHDLLLPRLTGDGHLLFIRRPYEPDGARKVSPWKVALDMLLFPIRVGVAVVHFFDWFSQVFSRKPLITAGGPPKEGPDARFLMLWGKMIDAEKAIRASKPGDAKALVPTTWQLTRRRLSDGHEEVLARGVLSFDLADDGTIVYTNGSAVFRLSTDGKSEQLCTGRLIEHVSTVG